MSMYQPYSTPATPSFMSNGQPVYPEYEMGHGGYAANLYPGTMGAQHVQAMTVPQGMPVVIPPSIPSGSTVAGAAGGISPQQQTPSGLMPIEESYIENILRLNLGKTATLFMTYENNKEWNAKIFKGIIEAAGRDHIIISDPTSNKRFLLLMINLDYITFDEELNYSYPR